MAADEFPMVMSLYFSLFARIILQAEDLFDVMLQQEAIKNQVGRGIVAYQRGRVEKNKNYNPKNKGKMEMIYYKQ